LPASIRVIKIVKDPVTMSEAYTLEFEVEAEESKDLLNELTSSPYGQRLIELLNQAQFLPELIVKSKEEMKEEAEKEGEAIKQREKELKDKGARDGREDLLKFIKEEFGDETAKEIEGKYNEKKDKDEKAKREKIVLIDDGREPE